MLETCITREGGSCGGWERREHDAFMSLLVKVGLAPAISKTAAGILESCTTPHPSRTCSRGAGTRVAASSSESEEEESTTLNVAGCISRAAEMVGTSQVRYGTNFGRSCSG